MKINSKSVRCFTAGIVLTATASGTACAATTLTLSDDQPPNYPTVQGDKAMARYLKAISNGHMTIKVYPNGQLGSEQSVGEQVQSGAIDMARINAAPLANFDSKMGVLSLPYIFSSKQGEWRVLNGPIGHKLLQSLKSAKMVGLAYYDSGQRSFYTTKKAGPIKSINDLKGMRIRVQKSKPMIAMIKALGATPVPMSYGNVYSALQNNAISGAENNIPSYGPYGVRHYEVAPNYTFDSHSRVPEVVVVGLNTWKHLSSQQQAWLQEAALASEAVEETAWQHLVQKTRNKLKGKVNFYHVDTAKFQQAMGPVYKKYGKEYGGLIQEIKNAEKESSQESK